ncbi:cytochrome c biogenesis protein CcdA [SAR202 cluster bacterium AC-647-N09_OGT_505m]|nr:cytochrome c biogenesis protein CcdA [SAR202 cluster bacterium AC-647-N09_OGT_505m]
MFISRAIITSIRETSAWRGIVLPAVVASLSLSIAVIGAMLLGKNSNIDSVNRFVETIAGDSATFLGDLGLLAPLGFAFAAGMVSAVNPCGFAMLPAYLGLYLGSNEQGDQDIHPIKHFAKGLKVGTSVTAGFIALFGSAGIIIGLGAKALMVNILPWLGLVTGISLALTGSWMVSGGRLYTGIPTRIASHMGDPGQVNVQGYFLFGLSYGTASLSCTLPIFLSVIGTSFAVSSIATSLGQFLLYALGMGVVILTLTMGISFFKGTLLRALRKTLPYIQPLGSWLMVVAGSYIVFYWLTIGKLT